MVETAGSNQVIGLSNISLTDFHVEIDIMQVDGTTNEKVVQILTSNYSEIDSGNGVLGEWKHFSFDKHNLETNSRFRIVTTGDCTKLRFKNFIIYGIQ